MGILGSGKGISITGRNVLTFDDAVYEQAVAWRLKGGKQ